jgi:predicted ATPase/class 3 adenylate cyclase/DNA-binding CsgD family transcriptional regulator
VVGDHSATVTFLFTDVEGSTALWERRPDAMRMALALHDDVLRSAIAAHDGRVFATGGDGFAAVFERAESGVHAAIAAQAALCATTWPDELVLPVRMGLHSGDAEARGGDYFGPAVNRAARVMDAANGAQVLVSASTRELVGGNRRIAWRWIDLGAHELRDVVDPVRLYRVDSAAFRSDARPPRTGSVRAGNLPMPSGPLLGRSEEVDLVSADLETVPVVTLTGVGGIGKTRLALEVGRQRQVSHHDGVWFAALDTVDRPESLIASMLGMFGIEPVSDDDLGTLIEGLRFRDALLILDNCEHLLDTVADVVSTIASECRTMRVLATSREPLDVEGERVRRIRSLSVDEGGAAAALFRLRAEQAGATVDSSLDAEAVTQICRRLDGIPLAIELAAARTRSLRPHAIADRLDDMFRLLTGGRRASTERHRTLRAALEWSHEQLSDVEQAVLARMSIFAGAFGLEAAESVCGSDDGIVDVLDRLVARSLLVPVEDGFETRFRLLEPVRHLAAEKLVERGETDTIRERHANHYRALMDRLGRQWRTGDDQTAWPIASRELPNLRAAFDHLIDTEQADDAERFVVDSYGPIACQFDVAPMYEWAPRALAVEPGHVGPATASACAVAAWGAIPRGDFETATRWLRRGVDAIDAGSRDDGLVSAAAIHQVLSGGEIAVSDQFLERSVVTALASDDLHRQVWVLTYAGRLDEALKRAQRLGNRTLLAMIRSNLAAQSSAGGDDSRELAWEAAQESHSYLLLNHATLELGLEQIRAGSPFDGLLLLRAPARDWLLRGDTRVWTILHAMAIGFAALGEVEVSARLAGAVGDRPLPFTTPRRRAELDRMLDECTDTQTRARHEAEGAGLDAGTLLVDALERIDVLASSLAHDHDNSQVDATDLTARQQEVAALVAGGFTNKQIAQRLGISRYTAETHVRNILERLGAASRSEIATWYANGSGMHAST